MGFEKFARDKLVLLVGILLPVLMMAAFLAAGSLPRSPGAPPRYDLVFFVDDFSATGNVPTTVRLLVRDGTLVAQYAPAGSGTTYDSWKKIYRYEAATGTVREIPFGFPADVGSLDRLREEPVAGLENVRLDTRLQAPDGYELAWDAYPRSGFFGGLFWRPDFGSPRLRNSSSSVPLELASGSQGYGNNLQFIGWVVP